jgi:hypothetical protein
MKIHINELRNVAEKIFQHLEEIHQEDFYLENDFYWEIPEESLYNVEQEPTGHSIGQLSDDWNDLQMILTNKEEPITYNLVDLAAILKAIGQKLVI